MKLQGNVWRHPLAIGVYLLLVIWLILPVVPEESGLRFGLGYRVFFSVMVVVAALFFLLLGREQVPVPRGRREVLLSIVAVYLITVGVLTLSGTVYPYPQFEIPKPAAQEETDRSPAEQGEELFFASIGGISCAQCHSLQGKGGKRAPAMDDYAARAQQAIDEGRYPNVSLEEYTRQHILQGSAYFHSDPRYPPIMPPLKNLLSEGQVGALVAFLLTTGGSGAPAAADEAAPTGK
ncbi:MAG: c-type cytochrome [Anaerolineae bacterium]